MSANESPARASEVEPSTGSPLMLVGFAVGVLSACSYIFLYYWLFAPLGPLLVGAVFAVVSPVSRTHRRRVLHLGEGALAASLFAVVFVIAAAIVLSNYRCCLRL